MKSELIIAVLILVLLLRKIGVGNYFSNGALTAFISTILGLIIIYSFVETPEGSLFGNMFITNKLIAFEKSILIFATIIIAIQSQHWFKNHEHVPEFFMLLLSSLLGMLLMISSGNFLIFYLSLELATIPLAALCNFDLEKRVSSEAAMKMIMSSAFSSGILLFGISLMYGATGSIGFTEVGASLDGSSFQIYAFVMIFTGFAFKLSVVPFHLWTADVYEGSPVSVTSFLSVVSKGSMVFVFVSTLYRVFGAMADVWYLVLFVTAVITMVTGNLFAIRQQNMKRFLAFSSIAQVGFILIGVSGVSQTGSAASVYFVLVYLFSNLGAFGVVNIISSITGKETIDEYKGLYKTNPALTWVLTISLFSLAGIPPTAGFFGKLFLLTAGAGKGNWVLIIIAALNMVVALYYYLRVIRAMFMDTNDEPVVKLNAGWAVNFILIVCVIGILVTGIFSGAYEYIYSVSIAP